MSCIYIYILIYYIGIENTSHMYIYINYCLFPEELLADIEQSEKRLTVFHKAATADREEHRTEAQKLRTELYKGILYIRGYIYTYIYIYIYMC